MRYKGTAKPVSDIGKELGVGTILEGSVRKIGSKVRITAQLVNARTEEHLWSQSYDRDSEDIFSIQSEIAQRIARALKVRVLAAEKKGLEKKSTDKPDAYTSYLRGRPFLNSTSEAGLKKAVERFQQALTEDPGYAKACADWLTLTRLCLITLNPGEAEMHSAVIDSNNGFAYFALAGLGHPRVVRIDLSSFTETGSVFVFTDPFLRNGLWSAVIDSDHGYAYFGSDGGDPRGIVIRVSL